MTKRAIAVKHLRAGMPLHEVASEMNVSFQTIVRYMKLQVAEGGVAATEVFFGIGKERRGLLKDLLSRSAGKADKSYYKLAAEHAVSWDEANLYWSLLSSTANRGDMYERVADLEVWLHQHIKFVLSREYGDSESDWWRGGVPLAVRKACVQAREEDEEPVESPFAYTTFIHLSEIIDKNWKVFSGNLPKSFVAQKQTFLSNLKKLNSIRNAVMHPVKGKTWNEDDFSFVGTLLSELGTFLQATGKQSTHIHRTVSFGALR
jgi:hypothetical protein